MRDFGMKKKTEVREDKQFVGRLITIAGRGKNGGMSVMLTYDNSGQTENQLEALECGSAGEDIMLNTGALIEEALNSALAFDFDAENLNSERIEIYAPGVVTDFITQKIYLEVIESGHDPRFYYRSRKITAEEIEMWSSIKELLNKLGDKVVIRNIGLISINKNKELKFANEKQKLLHTMQKGTWERVPGGYDTLEDLA